MTNGLLDTVFKTHGVDLVRGPASSPTTIQYGFIAETVGLEIGLGPGEVLVLRVRDTAIFKVNHDTNPGRVEEAEKRLHELSGRK